MDNTKICHFAPLLAAWKRWKSDRHNGLRLMCGLLQLLLLQRGQKNGPIKRTIDFNTSTEKGSGGKGGDLLESAAA